MARTAVEPRLQPGRIYRARDLARWSTNISRLTRRLVRERKLVRLAYGFYLCPDNRPYADRFLGTPARRARVHSYRSTAPSGPPPRPNRQRCQSPSIPTVGPDCL